MRSSNNGKRASPRPAADSVSDGLKSLARRRAATSTARNPIWISSPIFYRRCIRAWRIVFGLGGRAGKNLCPACGLAHRADDSQSVLRDEVTRDRTPFMTTEARKRLHDIRLAAEALCRFTDGKTVVDLQRDEILQAALGAEVGNYRRSLRATSRGRRRHREKFPDLRQIVGCGTGWCMATTSLIWTCYGTRPSAMFPNSWNKWKPSGAE